MILDTNVWVFGLRDHPDRPACRQLLRHLPELHIKIPRQILLELRANLTREEIGDLFRLVNRYADCVDVRRDRVDSSAVRKHREMGCRHGDAVVAAHIEITGVAVLISENRHFLETVRGLPFRAVDSETALRACRSRIDLGAIGSVVKRQGVSDADIPPATGGLVVVNRNGREHHDSSKADRGNFYRAEAKLNLPVYRDDEVREIDRLPDGRAITVRLAETYSIVACDMGRCVRRMP